MRGRRTIVPVPLLSQFSRISSGKLVQSLFPMPRQARPISLLWADSRFSGRLLIDWCSPCSLLASPERLHFRSERPTVLGPRATTARWNSAGCLDGTGGGRAWEHAVRMCWNPAQGAACCWLPKESGVPSFHVLLSRP